MTYAAAVKSKFAASLYAKIASATKIQVTEEPAKCVWRYGRYRPNGKFENSDDEDEARAEWIESRKDRDQRD
jgi:hypothetical protein